MGLHMSKGEDNIETKRTKVSKGRSSIFGWNFRLSIVKLLDKSTQSVIVLKVKFHKT